MVELNYVHTKEEYAVASELFKEYAAWLNIDLGFQKFEEELAVLSSMYGSPNGCIILAKDAAGYIGCIAVRKINEETGEIKRMYVKPKGQQLGTGTLLLHASLDFAKQAGYQKLQLDTLSNMLPAISLYKKNGFYEIPAYYFNPEPTAVYFEKKL